MNLGLFANIGLFGFEVPVAGLFTYGAAIMVTLFALPSFISTLRQRGIILGTMLLALLGAFSIGFEAFAVNTGLPYGKYVYDGVLGSKIFGAVPWTIALAYPILLLATFWLASKITAGFFRPLLAAIFTLLTTLVLDPAAVKLQFWKWEHAGPFFGAPYTHLIGWFVAGLAGAWFIQLFWGDKEVKRGLAYSGALMIWFWTGVNWGVGQWIPAAIGLAMSLIIFVVMILEKKAAKLASH